MGNHQAESKPVREPWPPPSLALPLLCQLPPSQLTGHLPPASGTAERWSSEHARIRAQPGSSLGSWTVCREDSHDDILTASPQPPPCPLELDANSEEQIGVSRTRHLSVSLRVQSSWPPKPQVLVQEETKPETPPLCVYPGEVTHLSTSWEPLPWGSGTAMAPCHHLHDPTPGPHLCLWPGPP